MKQHRVPVTAEHTSDRKRGNRHNTFKL